MFFCPQPVLSVFTSTDSHILKLHHQNRSLTSPSRYKSCHYTYAHNKISPKAFIKSLSLSHGIQGKLECLFCFCCGISQKIIMVKSSIFEESDLNLCPTLNFNRWLGEFKIWFKDPLSITQFSGARFKVFSSSSFPVSLPQETESKLLIQKIKQGKGKKKLKVKCLSGLS